MPCSAYRERETAEHFSRHPFLSFSRCSTAHDASVFWSAGVESRPQAAVELFIRDFRNDEKVFRVYVRKYASLADSCPSGMLSSKNLFGASNRLFQGGECFGTTLVTRQIRDVLPELAPAIGRARRGGRAIVLLERIDQL